MIEKLEPSFLGKGIELLLNCHTISGMWGMDGQGRNPRSYILADQRTKWHEKKKKHRKKKVQSEGVVGVREMQLLDRSHRSAALYGLQESGQY